MTDIATSTIKMPFRASLTYKQIEDDLRRAALKEGQA